MVVSLQVINPSDSPIQLYTGQNVDQFQSVFESPCQLTFHLLKYPVLLIICLPWCLAL